MTADSPKRSRPTNPVSCRSQVPGKTFQLPSGGERHAVQRTARARGTRRARNATPADALPNT